MKKVDSMEIEIKKEKDSCIQKDLKFELGNYTVFAGENNSGKTNLLKAIKRELENSSLHVIYIPAEKVVAEKEMDTSTQQDFLRTAIVELINVSFESKNISDPLTDIEKALPVEFNQYGVENVELTVKLSKPKKDDDYVKAIKDIYAKKIIESVTIIDGFSGKGEISISNVGQGTQRLIIASLINYLGKKRNIQNNKLALIFEEPELFLHPRLKESLHKNLFELSKKIPVVISTHDPFFIQLNEKEKIYQVFRRKGEKDGSTQVEPVVKKYLKHDSYAEINYQVFSLPSETYFLEIYDETKRKEVIDSNKYKSFDDHMFNTYFKSKGKKQNCKDDQGADIMPVTRLRHDIAHGLDRSKTPTTVKEATEDIINFIDKK